MISPGTTSKDSVTDLSSTSISSGRLGGAQFPSDLYPYNNNSTSLSGGCLKSDNLSLTTSYKEGGASSSFSFTRQDSTEKDNAQRRSLSSEDILRLAHFRPAVQSPVMPCSRPSVIQSSSISSTPTGDRHPKGLLQPSRAIEKAKAFMATAMGVCPSRGGGPVARGGGGGGGAQGSSGGSVHYPPPPLPYSTVKLGSHVNHQPQLKVTLDDKLGQLLERLVQTKRSYAYRRNSGNVQMHMTVLKSVASMAEGLIQQPACSSKYTHVTNSSFPK